MNNLLFDEAPLVIQPRLARAIGLNESIILQQLHYWLQKSNNIQDGRKWVYNTYKDWNDQFPFWSEKTIKRIITKLENEGFILTGNFNKLTFDKTKWYSLNYEKLSGICPDDGDNLTRREGQTDPTEEDNLTPPIPENTQRLSTEISLDIHTHDDGTHTDKSKDIPPYEEIIAYLNKVTGSAYQASSKSTREKILARWNQGFRLQDFHLVIDFKTSEWLHNEEFSKYLRPETLFSPKFESYLNAARRKLNGRHNGDPQPHTRSDSVTNGKVGWHGREEG